MVAPNGARKTKADHHAIPLTIDEIVKTAIACEKAGADAIHAHVRDNEGQHVLDTGLYKELINEINIKSPELEVQITTESVGKYSAIEQRKLVEDVAPKAVSVALREMLSDADIKAQKRFYWAANEQKIELQHILYSVKEVVQLAQLLADGFVPKDSLSVLFVLGRYTKNQTSNSNDLLPFLQVYAQSELKESSKFMVCAFGENEMQCLLSASVAGGDCRVGFENNHFLPNGSLAIDNAAQVAALVKALEKSSNEC